MSDSASKQWLGTGSLAAADRGPSPLGLHDPNPVLVKVAGNMENVNLVTTKQSGYCRRRHEQLRVLGRESAW